MDTCNELAEPFRGDFYTHAAGTQFSAHIEVPPLELDAAMGNIGSDPRLQRRLQHCFHFGPVVGL